MVKIVVKLVHFKQAMVSQSADKIIIILVLFLFSSRGCYMPTIFILCSRIWTFIMKPTVAMERRSLGQQRAKSAKRHAVAYISISIWCSQQR
jgi:hypothetical protein